MAMESNSIQATENIKTMELWNNRFRNKKRQTVLHLCGRRLSMVPHVVTDMTNFEVLNLEMNDLTELPASISQLKSLKELNLTFNILNTLPEGLGELINLRCLKINCNRLTSVPKSIKYLTKLQELDLSYNKLKELPKGIADLKDLEILNVCGNPLASGQMQKLMKLMDKEQAARLSTDIPVSEPREEGLKKDHKTTIFEDEVKEEGVSWNLREVASCISFSPMAVLEPKQITCSLWKPETCSPPLKENESLVSNVIELSCEHDPPGAQFSKDNDKKVMIMLSHSATDLVGYELVIKELVDQDNNEWIDLETRNIWKASDLPDKHCRGRKVPEWMFPFAEAETTNCSSFAVIWRLKSFTFYKSSSQATDFTCTVPEFPGLCVTIPQSSLPASEHFSVTIKLQEVPCGPPKARGSF